MPKYTIRKNRLKSAFIEGFTLTEKGSLVYDKDSMFHWVFLKALDGAADDSEWGRLFLNITRSDDMVLSVYVVATNIMDMTTGDYEGTVDDYLLRDDVESATKLSLLKMMGAKRFVESDDMLLYDMSGRYLFLAFELLGEGEAEISDIVVDDVGDNFMAAFPEIYQSRNSFFHRYLSVFSSIYNDFQTKIDRFYEILDLDTCPKEMLIQYGGWMGIDLRGGFLPEDTLRQLVKEAYELNKMKGTKKAIERILEIILGEKAIVVEHSMLRTLQKEERAELLPGFETKGVYDVTVLVKGRLTEELESRLTFILNQFKPVRARISIAQMDENVIIDSKTYLDINAKIPEEQGVELDETSLGGVITLQ